MLRRGDEPFASGRSRFVAEGVGPDEISSKIQVPIRLCDAFDTTASVDTGGVWLVLTPDVAAELDLAYDTTARLQTRWGPLNGQLGRVNVTLLAEEGDDLDLEVTAFVPQLPTQAEATIPTVLGWSGCLEFLRFAIDPRTDSFYFGQMEPDL